MTALPIQPTKQLILASASPRRRQLLSEAGYRFDVVSPTVDEPGHLATRLEPAAMAEALSYFKAKCVALQHPDALILGADTVVALDGRIYQKPIDADDARRILNDLMHHPHEVITGVTLLDPSADKRIITHDVTRITMRPMSPTVLDEYIESGLWQGKAGAYGLQDHDDQFVESIEGSPTNVVGLPMERVLRLLEMYGRNGGLPVSPDGTGWARYPSSERSTGAE